MQPRLLRIFYAMEFLIASAAIAIVWSQVGGQSHLDLMPWYLKLGLVIAGSAICVKLTAAMTEAERAWTRRSLLWLVLLLLFGWACAMVTYYYHLQEPAEPDDTEDVQAL